MRFDRWKSASWGLGLLGLIAAAGAAPRPVAKLVPGTGQKSAVCGDDFEDPNWKYVFNNPKSSYEQDDQIRYPAGYATNGRLGESGKRGHPDVVQRVPTPEGGLPGSTGALRLRTLQSGIPGRISNDNMQDDLIVNVQTRIGNLMPLVSTGPSVVIRVYVPPFDQWEQRSGNSFGFRISLEGDRSWDGKHDQYWPGIFIFFHCKADRKVKDSFAQLMLRADQLGHDFWGPKITEPGWWTLGISVPADGSVQYYAHAGVDDLTEADFLASQFCYGFKADRFQSFFFDLVNRDDGHSWSTSWIVDDLSMYFVHPPQTQSQQQRAPAYGRRGR